MSGDGKRSVGHRLQATAPVLDSTEAAIEERLLFRRCQAQSRHLATALKMTRVTRCGRTLGLFLFAGWFEGWLPRCGLLAWRGGDHLDFLLLGFLGFPIASLLAVGHVNLLELSAAANNVSPRRGP